MSWFRTLPGSSGNATCPRQHRPLGVQRRPRIGLYHYCRYILEQLGSKGGGPRPPTRPEPVQYILEIHCRLYTKIHHTQHFLPNDFNKTNITELPVTRRENNYCLTCRIHANATLLEIFLDNTQHLLPLVSVRPILVGNVFKKIERKTRDMS